jgi:hypothetical protein
MRIFSYISSLSLCSIFLTLGSLIFYTFCISIMSHYLRSNVAIYKKKQASINFLKILYFRHILLLEITDIEYLNNSYRMIVIAITSYIANRCYIHRKKIAYIEFRDWFLQTKITDSNAAESSCCQKLLL